MQKIFFKRKIDIWNLENGKCVCSIMSSFEYIYDVAFHNNICMIIGIKNMDSNQKNISIGVYKKSVNEVSMFACLFVL